MEKKVKAALETIDSVSTTADIWTAHPRSYFGMTVHWINPITLNAVRLLYAAPGLLAGTHMMSWLLKLNTCMASMGLMVR